MSHVEPETLALAALGEPLPDTDREHLAGCRPCADEVEALTAAVAVGRSARDTLVPPPAAVWDRVRGELGLSEGLAPDGTGRVVETALPTPSADQPPAEATPIRARRRERGGGGGGRAMPWLAAAAAAGVVVGGAGAVWLMGRDTAPGAAVLAQATLEPLPGWEASGQAHVEESADGERRLVVSLEGGESEGFHEVWLIDREVTRLVSLGILEGSSGEFTVPSGLDLDDFAVVDVSDEPLDGDPAHSGDSIIRGILGA